MSYVINSKLLPLGTPTRIEQVLFETLDMYKRGEDLSNSPLIQWGQDRLQNNMWFYGCKKEQDLPERQKRVIELYHSLKENGYNGSTISVYFDDSGQVNVYDGFHRLTIMKYLGIDADMNVKISYHDTDPKRRGDFPLSEMLQEVNRGKHLYQPCSDPRVADFKTWRNDSKERLNFVLDVIRGKTVLDIGCSEGYFSRELAKCGFDVTAIDSDPRRIAITKYLATINNVKINWCVANWHDFLENKKYDAILFLSVFHHDLIGDVEGAFEYLQLFRGKVKQLFFETPLASKDIKWLDQSKAIPWEFTERELERRVELETGLTSVIKWRGIRPVFLFEE